MASHGDDRIVQSLCRACVAGCGINVRVDADGDVAEIRGDPAHPLSRGYLCPKGFNLAQQHTRPDLLTTARVRGVETTWDEAVDDLCRSLASLAERHGAGVIGSYAGTAGGNDLASSSALRRLMVSLGSKQIYSPLTVDHAPAWMAADMVTGSGPELQPRWYPEDEASRLVLFIGCNPIVSHGYFSILPNAARRISAYRKRGGRVWAIDPRVTETAKGSDGHLACLPGTDWLLMCWLLKELLRAPPYPEQLAVSTVAEDLQHLASLVQSVTSQSVAAYCDVEEETAQRLLDDVRAAGRIAIVTGTGLLFSESGLLCELLRWAILAVTDSLDQPGGVSFDTGHFFKLDEKTDWANAPSAGRGQAGPSSRPELPGVFGEFPVASMIDEIEAGNLKALLINGGSPLAAMPEPDRLRAAFKKLEVLAVLEIVEAPHAALATHLIPGTDQLAVPTITAWNGRMSYVPAVRPLKGDRGPGWKVWGRIGEALGTEVLFGLSVDEATHDDLLRKMLPSARFDFESLRAAGAPGIEMPKKWDWVRQRAVPGGRWRIAPPILLQRLREKLGSVPSLQADRLALICQRQNGHLNAMHYAHGARQPDRPNLQMSSMDAIRLGLADGQSVLIAGEAGSVGATLAITDKIRAGAVSLPHGWYEANVCNLVSRTETIDSMTGQPQMSALPVTVSAMPVLKTVAA